MDKSVVERVSRVVLMPGVTNVNILPDADQVWVSVVGHEETRVVVATLANMFNSEANDYSDLDHLKEANQLSYTIYPSGLILSIDGKAKEKLSAATESISEENVHPHFSIDLGKVESLMDRRMTEEVLKGEGETA